MNCEYNETLTRYAIYDDPAFGKAAGSTCQSEATWQLGTTNQWHLCDEHAELPIFRRLKKRVRMEELRRVGGVTEQDVSNVSAALILHGRLKGKQWMASGRREGLAGSGVGVDFFFPDTVLKSKSRIGLTWWAVKALVLEMWRIS